MNNYNLFVVISNIFRLFNSRGNFLISSKYLCDIACFAVNLCAYYLEIAFYMIINQ